MKQIIANEVIQSQPFQQERIDEEKPGDGIYKTRGFGTKDGGSVDKENAGDKPTGERKMGSVQKKRETYPRQCRRNYESRKTYERIDHGEDT